MAAAVALAGAARSGSPRARRPAGPAGSVPHQPGGMTMKTTIAIALLAVGAFLTFAVNIHPGFISLQIAGLVLIVTGITGLCVNQRGTGSLRRNLALLRDLLEQDPRMEGGTRAPLEDLLSSASVPGSSQLPGSAELCRRGGSG
jgi:hypothetical protein